jgi:hypothetical protein
MKNVMFRKTIKDENDSNLFSKYCNLILKHCVHLQCSSHNFLGQDYTTKQFNSCKQLKLLSLIFKNTLFHFNAFQEILF